MGWIIRLSIFVIFAIVVLHLFNVYYGIQNKIDYTFRFTGVKGDVGQLIGYLGGDKSHLQINYALDLVNNSNGQITFSNLLIQVFYQGVMVAYSPPDTSNLKTTVLQGANTGKNKISYTGTMIAVVNTNAINMGLAIAAGKEVKIDYKVKVGATVFNIPVTYSDSYIYKA